MTSYLDINDIFNKINTLNTTERRCYIKFYLCRTKSPYYVNIKTTKQVFGTYTQERHYENKYYNRKYEIFVALLNYIKEMGGVIDKKLVYHLKSDCKNQSDFQEFQYHLYKTPPNVNLIIDFLSRYEYIFNDQYFNNINNYLKNTQITASNNPITSLKGNDILFLYSCNKSKNLFYVTPSKVISNNIPYRIVRIMIMSNSRIISNKIKNYIDNNFVVNNSFAKSEGFFILDSNKEPLTVELYNNQIIGIVDFSC